MYTFWYLYNQNTGANVLLSKVQLNFYVILLNNYFTETKLFPNLSYQIIFDEILIELKLTTI